MSIADFPARSWIDNLPDDPVPALDVGPATEPPTDVWERALAAAMDPAAPADDLIDLVPAATATDVFPQNVEFNDPDVGDADHAPDSWEHQPADDFDDHPGFGEDHHHSW